MKISFNPDLPEDSNILKPVPLHVKPDIFNWAQSVFYFEDTWGYFLMQEYVSGEIKLYSRKAIFNETCTFYTIAEKPSIVFQFHLQGAVHVYLQPLAPALLNDNEFGFLYFPAVPVAVTVTPGKLESLYFEMQDSWLSEMAKTNNDIAELRKYLFKEAAHGVLDKRFQLDDTTYFWINRILNCNEEGYNLNIELMISLLKTVKIYHNLSQEEHLPDDSGQRPVYTALLKIWKDIKIHPNKRWFTLEALSGEYHFSEQVLRINFKEIFHETFSGYLHRRCMQRAFYWLENTNWPLSKIAEDLGYDNTRSLTHAIQKWFNKTPEQIRGKPDGK